MYSGKNVMAGGMLHGKHISCLHARILVTNKVVEVQFG